MVKLNDDMFILESLFKNIFIYDENGELIKVGDNYCCFFEVVWMYKYNGVYYFFYLIGDIYKIVYVMGSLFLGFFMY